MTSLMVIFILLLLVFVNNRASVNASTTQHLLIDLRRQLQSSGIAQVTAQLDRKDPYTIVLTIPNELLTFQPNAHQLRAEGEEFLKREVPKLATLLCESQYRNAVESIVVEGHSDNTPYHGISPEESESLNLKLSQDRSMEVVKRSLFALMGHPVERGCLLEKISASGRGEQDLQATPELSRRVVFKIRVNSTRALEAFGGLHGTVVNGPDRKLPPQPTAAAAKVLRILHDLGAASVPHMRFQLTQEEINEYITYALQVMPRPGIDSVYVRIFPNNYISTLTVIDFDAIERWRPGTIPSLFHNVLNGRKTLWLDYRFQIHEGMATFSIEKAYYQQRPLPQFFVRELVQLVGSRQPEHFDVDEPIQLPFGLRGMSTAKGRIQAWK